MFASKTVLRQQVSHAVMNFCGLALAAVRKLVVFTAIAIAVALIAIGATFLLSIILLDKQSRAEETAAPQQPSSSIQYFIDLDDDYVEENESETSIQYFDDLIDDRADEDEPIVDIPSQDEIQSAILWKQIVQEYSPAMTWQQLIEQSLREQYSQNLEPEKEPLPEFPPVPNDFRSWKIKELQKFCRQLNAIALERKSDNQIRGHSSKNIKPNTIVYLIEQLYKAENLEHLVPAPTSKRKAGAKK